jgi:hypothetical protein
MVHQNYTYTVQKIRLLYYQNSYWRVSIFFLFCDNDLAAQSYCLLVWLGDDEERVVPKPPEVTKYPSL